MSENKKDRFASGDNGEINIDDLLDRSIEHYRAATPRPGLEQRLLARLKEAPRLTSLWNWRVALPAALTVFVAAGALYVAFRPATQRPSPALTTTARISPITPITPDVPPVPEQSVIRGNRSETSKTSSTSTPRRTVQVVARVTQRPRVPVQESQETLLLEFLQASGAMPNLKALKEDRSAPPREIADLAITPLTIEFLPGFDPEAFEQGE